MCLDRCERGSVCGRGACQLSDLSTCAYRAGDGAYQFCSRGVCAGWEGPQYPGGDDSFGGICVRPEYCIARGDADPPLSPDLAEGACRYSDGTEVVTGPPPLDACPPSDPRARYCGGPCSISCPEDEFDFFEHRRFPCAGLSDNRGFGVCAVSLQVCVEGQPRPLSTIDGEQVVCMVPMPQPAEHPAHGYEVPLSVCRDYVRHHPDHATCVDGNFDPIL